MAATALRIQLPNTRGAALLDRRAMLARLGAGALALGGAESARARQAEALRAAGKACVMLFMRGGPSQFETFDPKPGHPNGGPTRAIATRVPGVAVAEGWERMAERLPDVCVIRSLTNKEGEHGRATYQLHTGFLPGGGLRHPPLGATAARELEQGDFDLPRFVAIGTAPAALRMGSGFLDARFAPLAVRPPHPPRNVELPSGVRAERLDRRLALLRELEEDYAQAGRGALVEQHRAVQESARRLVLSDRLRAFDLKHETPETIERYGKTPFAQGCLMARRLVEAGVTFVEVELDGWDTHVDNFGGHKPLVAQADQAMAALLDDLKARGLLDSTLVVWMGEFGRTPKINNRQGGRDHYPQAFCGVLAGAGARGGAVVGATSASGDEVVQRPVEVPDLFCTFCQALGMDPRKERLATLDRPVKIVDEGRAVDEVFRG